MSEPTVTRQTQVVEGRQIAPIIFEIPEDGLYRVSVVAQSELGRNATTGMYLNWVDTAGESQFQPLGSFGFIGRILSTVPFSAKAGTTAQISVVVNKPGDGNFVLRMAIEQISKG